MDRLTENSVDIRQSLNVCRCCLGENCVQGISAEYNVSGQKNMHLEMLKDTFNIQVPDECGLQTAVICDQCMSKIQEAHAFKEMVVQNHEVFLKIVDEYLKSVQEPKTDNMEMEVIKDEAYTDEEHFNDDDDEILANLKQVTSREEEFCTIPSKSQKRLRNGTRKVEKYSDNHTEILSGSSKPEKDWSKIAERRGNGPLLRQNSLKLIENSTLCVFQWNKSRYRCFCCKEPFSDMNLLRNHTNSTHSMEDIEKKIIVQQNRLVKVEVSILYCKICGLQTENLNTLRTHLKSHDLKFDFDEDLLVPFKIDSNLKCQICLQSFTMFRLLNIHMNRHFQKQVCHICGAGFSNLVFLNLHKTRSHRPFFCKDCNVTFKNKLEKKHHDINVHNLKIERKLRFPCPYCQERFFQENFRVQHLVEKHGLKRPEHKCTICSKVFITKSLCNNHVKNVHLKEKNQECDVCHHFFYTKSDVARHKVTHTGEKKFSCLLCNNLFATKDSLRRHMKRTHVGA